MIEESLDEALRRARRGPETDVAHAIGEALRCLGTHQADLARRFDRLDQHEAEAGIDPFDDMPDPETREVLAAVPPGRAELAHLVRRAAA